MKNMIRYWLGIDKLEASQSLDKTELRRMVGQASNVASATLAVAPGSALLVGYGPGFIDAEIQQSAFEMMANAHPHETFAAYPDRFVVYAQHINPALSREEIEQILRDTEHIES